MSPAPTIRSQALAQSLPTGSETDEPSINLARTTSGEDDTETALPKLSQRLRHTSSFLSVVLSETRIYAGTQAGEILVYDLNTFQREAVLEAHKSSVLALHLSPDHKILFSAASDRVVNAWDNTTLERTACYYTLFDVGDIFCIDYSALSRTLYLGAQNTTIQWCQHLESTYSTPSTIPPLLSNIPASFHSADYFFTSPGPGGVRTPRPSDSTLLPRHARGGTTVEISKHNVHHFAHYGYVNCMLLTKDPSPSSSTPTTTLPTSEILLTGGSDGIIKAWTLSPTGAITELYHLPSSTNDDDDEEGRSVLSLALDGPALLYSGRSGGEVDVWDLETRQRMRNLKVHRDDVLTCCVGAGFMFSAAVTGWVHKFDRQHQLKYWLRAHEGRILTSTVGTRGEQPVYVTGGNDCTLAIWDVSGCVVEGQRRKGRKGEATSDERLVESLRRFVSYKTVSSDPRFKVDCRRGASWLRAVLKGFGAVTEMLPTEGTGNPVIYARFRGAPGTRERRKKILFYGHYDVVAANCECGKWVGDPFAMEGIDGYLYGRGTSDNKGPIMAAIFACAELIAEQALGSDIVFLIEGEEECGSRGFEKTVRAHKDKIGDVDWILLANSYWLDDRIPCLTYGLRGVIHATVRIESNHPDLHSGVDGSAELDEPLKDLVFLLGTLSGKNGEVKIPGFYDPVPEISEEEAKLYADITHALVQRNPELGDPVALASSLMRKWREASLTIHRFETSGPNNETIIPRSAKASISMRLVPNQEAAQVAASLQEFLETQFNKLDSSNHLSVTIDHQAEPWLGDWTNQLFQTLEHAIMDAWGPIDLTRPQSGHDNRHGPSTAATASALKVSRSLTRLNATTTKPAPTTSSNLAKKSHPAPTIPVSELTRHLQRSGLTNGTSTTTDQQSQHRTRPLYIREGGSIPAVRFLEKEFNAPAAHFPCGQASDSAHLDNERLRLVNLYKSKDIFKTVFRDLPAR